MVADRLRGTAHEAFENRFRRGHVSDGADGAGSAFNDITEGPASDDAVECHDAETGQYAQVSDEDPAASRADYLERADGVLLRVTPDHDFGDHDGKADHKNADEVDENECAAAVRAGKIGEFPDIPEADR